MSQESGQRVIRLPRTTSAPTVHDLHYVLKRVRDNVGARVESTWVPPGGTKMYQLIATVPPGAQMPTWRLFEHVGNEQTEIWTAESAQIEKVANDISQLGGAVTAKLDQARTLKAANNQPVAPPGTLGVEVEEEEPVESINQLGFLGAAGDAVLALRGQLQDHRSGLFSSSVFIKLLEYECGRFRTFGYPVSLIVFEMVRNDGVSLSASAATTAGLRLNLIKSDLEFAGRLEENIYALVMPNKPPAAAAQTAGSMIEILVSSPLEKGLDKTNLSIKCGIVGLPDHGDDLETLVLAGKAALAGAPERGAPRKGR